MALGWPAWAALLVVLAVATAGCQEGGSPAPPFSKLLIDYDSERGLLWFYLFGVEQIRFDNLTLTLNSSQLKEPQVYSLQRNTSLRAVSLVARAEVEDKVYLFAANLTLVVQPGEENPVLVIEPVGQASSYERSLPYTKILDREAVG